MDNTCQFDKKMTNVMGQIPSNVSINTINRIIYGEFVPIMQHGISLWTGQCMKNVHGMISHCIADMEDRDSLLRKRKSGKYTRCDGTLWLGYKEGASWPANVNNLMELNTIIPGPYLLKIHKYLKQTLSGRPGFWDVWNPDHGKPITLTNDVFDIYSELPIASGLKSTIEINHTTVLGCLGDAFELIWYNLCKSQNFDEFQLRLCMKAYLNEYFTGINGCNSLVSLYNMNVTKFNSMNRAWQILVEMLICLPTIVDWYDNCSLLISLIRITGALYNVQTENELEKIQNRIKPILQKSYVIDEKTVI